MVLQEEVIANASVVKTGRNLTVVALEFKLKKTGNLLYLTHATFYNMPFSSLWTLFTFLMVLKFQSLLFIMKYLKLIMPIHILILLFCFCQKWDQVILLIHDGISIKIWWNNSICLSPSTWEFCKKENNMCLQSRMMAMKFVVLFLFIPIEYPL